MLPASPERRKQSIFVCDTSATPKTIYRGRRWGLKFAVGAYPVGKCRCSAPNERCLSYFNATARTHKSVHLERFNKQVILHWIMRHPLEPVDTSVGSAEFCYTRFCRQGAVMRKTTGVPAGACPFSPEVPTFRPGLLKGLTH